MEICQKLEDCMHKLRFFSRQNNHNRLPWHHINFRFRLNLYFLTPPTFFSLEICIFPNSYGACFDFFFPSTLRSWSRSQQMSKKATTFLVSKWPDKVDNIHTIDCWKNVRSRWGHSTHEENKDSKRRDAKRTKSESKRHDFRPGFAHCPLLTRLKQYSLAVNSTYGSMWARYTAFWSHWVRLIHIIMQHVPDFFSNFSFKSLAVKADVRIEMCTVVILSSPVIKLHSAIAKMLVCGAILSWNGVRSSLSKVKR